MVGSVSGRAAEGETGGVREDEFFSSHLRQVRACMGHPARGGLDG
jgi:hypothetical protein